MYFPSSSTPLLLASAMARPQNFVVPPSNSIFPPHNLVSPPSNLRINQSENPNADVDVIALSPNEITTTKTFTCEMCYERFARKQNMQVHGRKHGLPWKPQKNQVKKRKVYICPELTCVRHNPVHAIRDITAIKKHFLRKHGKKNHLCLKCRKPYAVRSDRDAHSKTCTKKYSETSSSRNTTMSLTEMTTPPSGGRRPIFSSGVAAEDFSQSSPNLGLMAHNDHNIMNFHQNNVPSLFTNGVNEFGDGDNGNLLGLMNSFGPTIDHQSRSRNIFDPHFVNNLNIEGLEWMTIFNTVNGQGGNGGHGGSGGYGGQDGYGGQRNHVDYGGYGSLGIQGGYDVQGDLGVENGYGVLDVQGGYGQGVHGVQDGLGYHGVQVGQSAQCGYGGLSVQGVQDNLCMQGGLGSQDDHGDYGGDLGDFGLWNEVWTPE